MIKIIYAATTDGLIGRNNRLPWYIPDDLKHFYELTKNEAVLMGRNTWDSLPGKQRPLKDRINLVLSRDTSLKLPGAIVYNSFESAVADHEMKYTIWVIGGSDVLKQALKHACEINRTVIHNKIMGDKYAPPIPEEEWEVVDKSTLLTHGDLTYHYERLLRY